MSSTMSSPAHPLVGTIIDSSLELVEVLGVGGYGVVYRAVDIHSSIRKSYAVKCLLHHSQAPLQQAARQRQIHIREIALHQLASAHPGVVSLHRVIEELSWTYLIMDYAPDHDLFTQILHSCRYLGDDMLIKHVFLQLLDAIEYCHSLGIYHRDLKPENVLCFDDGLRIAVTDFGLATTDKLSEEFRTGSVYHMSPECQGGEFAPTGNYSPMFNDIWSLGIILLNLATGRNPWKSATEDDPTFQAYLQDPAGFLPTVLPISPEVNDILIRMLEVDWRERMTLPEVREAIEGVTSFYVEGVVFEGSMARCSWEEGMDIDDGNAATKGSHPPLSKSKSHEPESVPSRWSNGSAASDIVFATQSVAHDSSYGIMWNNYSSGGATWALESQSDSESSESEPDLIEKMDSFFDRPQTPLSAHSPTSSFFSNNSLPVTPNSIDLKFGTRTEPAQPKKSLTVDTDCPQPRVYNANASMASFSTGSSMMQTAIEYDPYDTSFFYAGAANHSRTSIAMIRSAGLDAIEDKEMTSPSTTGWASSPTEVSSPIRYSSSNGSTISSEMSFARSETPSLDMDDDWPALRVQALRPQHKPSQHSPPVYALMTEPLPPSRPSIFTPKKPPYDIRSKAMASIFNPIKFFPRSPPPAPGAPSKASHTHRRRPSEPLAPSAHNLTPPPPTRQSTWAGRSAAAGAGSKPKSPPPLSSIPSQDHIFQRPPHLRSPRLWFMTGKFFASTGAS